MSQASHGEPWGQVPWHENERRAKELRKRATGPVPVVHFLLPSLLLLPVLQGRHSHLFPENLGEITGTVKAALQGDFRHGQGGACQKRNALGNAVIRDMGHNGAVVAGVEQAAAFPFA